MNNKGIYLFALLAFVSCQQLANESPIPDTEVQTVTFHLTEYDGEYPETKTSYKAVDGGYIFNWAEGDVVGIVSPEGNQLKFPIKDEFFGQQYADFDGRGFALVANTAYSSYYPFIPDYDLVPTSVPVSYDGQICVGSNDLTHLGDYSFSAARGNSPDAGKLIFTFLNIGSPHLYRLPALPGNYSSLTLHVSANKYIMEGTIDLTANSDDGLIAITPTRVSDTITLDLTGTNMASVDRIWCWMMLPPAEMAGETIHLTLTMADGTSLIASVNGVDYPANYRKVFNALTSAWPAVSETSAEGGNVTVKLIRSAESDAVTVTSDSAWLTQSSSTTDGLVTTYTFIAAENTGAERTANISFAETSTGLTNRVQVRQLKAGSIIGIGGWDPENHQGNAD